MMMEIMMMKLDIKN